MKGGTWGCGDGGHNGKSEYNDTECEFLRKIVG